MQETVRSVVKTWELDALEHFTTAFYYRALSTATMRMTALLGYQPCSRAAPWTEYSWTKFLRELRAGDAYHVTSGLIEADATSCTLGHRLVNSETGALCTTFLQRLSRPPRFNGRLDCIEWPDDEPERRASLAEAARWVPASTTVVRPEDLDAAGRLDLSALIHFTSDANVQFQNALGMTSSYMRDNRIGYSTAEYQLSLRTAPPPVGTALEIRSTIAHLGRSSLWFVHDIFDASEDIPLGRLTQMGVHLDLVARRPSPVPAAIRERAEVLMGEPAAAQPSALPDE